MVIILIIELIIYIIGALIFENIRNFKFYNSVISSNESQFDMFVSLKERLAYRITKLVVDMSIFSIAPPEYHLHEIEERLKEPCSKFERMVLQIMRFGYHIVSFWGNILFDIIWIFTVLTGLGYIKWDKVWDLLLEFVYQLKQISVINCIQEIITYIQDNSNFIIVILILVLSVYIGVLNRKRSRFDIEAIWEEQEQDKLKEIAQVQKDIEDTLNSIRLPIYQNLKICRKVIGQYCDKNDNQVSKIIGLQNYDSDISGIKNNLRKITIDEGIQIYYRRNKRIYLQLMLLGLLPSFTDSSSLFEIERFTEEKINKNCKTKESLIETWSYGIATLNGIERFLKFSYSNRKRYKKIVKKIAAGSYLDEVAGKVK